MEVHVVVAPVFATNCCVVVAGPRHDDGTRDCVVVDPGAGVADGVARVVDDRRLRVRAVLATHGHVDHTWDAAALCERYGVPMRLHAADAYRLTDPFGTLGLGAGGPGVSGALRQALAGLGLRAEDHRAPSRVEPFDGDGRTLTAGDVVLRAVHAPGHTEGSTLYVLDDADPPGVVLAGDVLFAGSVGRTDLPGGDPETMRATLRDVVARLDPALAVVPGHGPATTVGQELATNPFLAAR
ncbi:MBL fold metallo-hydrolase [Isoptericola variabilis]|uniref:Beta-lactamase domain-containing protein n=1 Tax=Isoptericola variabilis (strain 225) TaxID=743718 RepID=F6FVG6_ISOV2|nr:MBL fold metallo-hydrolase [Isoptericola variabilis]AEG44393.1 beta-lactamase domain-containing protein [Isoptericola variabilis 225]TWH34386.1 glyoxylase-like metal-dependent hydrolase (beta-lactamase superfamily II) [Isoptericola variabilis J7]